MAQTDYKREALPHDVQAYQQEAGNVSMSDFAQMRPYPFLLYARSTLWDPALILAMKKGAGSETRLANYNLEDGGMTFLSPIRKVQSDERMVGILLGRSPTINDVVVPVSSISTRHARFVPPAPNGSGQWTVTDLASRNGTFLKEDRLGAHQPFELKDGQYLRLGGNLIAWFLYPERLWKLLQDPNELRQLTDL